MAAVVSKWKREREEDGNDPAEPSPKRERESSPVTPCAAAENDPVTEEPVVNEETSMKYVKEVKATFEDDAGRFQEFLDLIQDVRRKQVDHAGVVSRITELFKDHRRLIFGFNMFLPEDEQITLPSTEPAEVAAKQRGIVFERKVDALGKSKYKAFSEILAGYKNKSNTIDQVYKLTETLFADQEDMIAEFRTFLPTLGAPSSPIMVHQEPDRQQALVPCRKVKRVHDLSAHGRESEAPRKSSKRADIARKGKAKIVETTSSKEVAARKLKERTSNLEEEAGIRTKPTEVPQRARTKPSQAREQARMPASNATGGLQVQPAPRNAAAAARSPRPASDQRVAARKVVVKRPFEYKNAPRAPPTPPDQRVSARTPVAKRPFEYTNAPRARPPHPDQRMSARPAVAKRPFAYTDAPRAPPRPLPSIAEIRERLKKFTKCRPDCKACEHVEYPVFDWHAEDPEYHAKGKANREREIQALIARGVPGSFNDSSSL